MKITLSTSEAISRLLKDENAKWTYEAAKALVDYYEELENDSGTEIDFCPVAIRCDWTHYANFKEIAEYYSKCSGFPNLDRLENDDEREEAVLTWIDDQTTRLNVSGANGFLILNF